VPSLPTFSARAVIVRRPVDGSTTASLTEELPLLTTRTCGGSVGTGG
jgi:hypothetical protein